MGFQRACGADPWSADDALVGLCLYSGQPDPGVRRGRGRPPHFYWSIFVTHYNRSPKSGITRSQYQAFQLRFEFHTL
jgi:hypothetical protein